MTMIKTQFLLLGSIFSRHAVLKFILTYLLHFGLC